MKMSEDQAKIYVSVLIKKIIESGKKNNESEENILNDVNTILDKLIEKGTKNHERTNRAVRIV